MATRAPNSVRPRALFTITIAFLIGSIPVATFLHLNERFSAEVSQ
jgi:hypothetical protein